MRKIILILFLLLISCEKYEGDGWVLYKVPAGEHNQFWKPLPRVGSIFAFEFKTDSSWLQSATPSGVNKIAGVTYGMIHENSARFGWQYVDGRILEYAYTYVNGERFYEIIDTLEVGKSYYRHIERDNDQYYFRTEKHIYKYPAGHNLPGVVCLPYIGGNGTFEKDWNCWLNIKL